MINLIKLSTLIFAGILLFSSCKKEKPTNKYEIPTTYSFEKVNYSGQTDRLDMMGEITSYLKTAHSSGAAALNATKIKEMYAQTGNHYSTTALNSSSKQLKNKTYSSMQTKFDEYMDSVASASNFTNMTASNGQAGILSSNDGTKHYLFNANGVELTQIIEKGLMGACFYYQATAVYMGSGKMDVDNETILADGTKMQHHWDECFGYFAVPTDFPTTTSGSRFWGKYCNKQEAVYPLNAKMMDNFIKGRAAIGAKDLDTRDQAISALRKNWEQVVAATAIYYMNDIIGYLDTTNGDPAKAYHAMSEAYAFIMSLKYGAGSIAPTDVDAILVATFGSADPLQANFYMVTKAKIETAKTSLVTHITDLASVKDAL